MNGQGQTDTPPPRPKALAVIAENIPAELKQVNQWVTWKFEYRDRWTKPPYRVDGSSYAKANDPATWGSFSKAFATYSRGTMCGVGFEPTAKLGLVLIDVDHCVDLNSKKIAPWATEIIARFATYVERSPVDGVRIIAKGTLPRAGRKKGDVEIYSASHYLTLTGQKFKSKPATIEPCQEAIDWLYETYFKEPEREEPKPRSNGNGSWLYPSDDELLDRAFAAKNGDKLKALFDGDTSGHNGDDSAADLALCSMLAFWAADKAQIDRLFRRSGLMRDKWDEKHGATTYGERTIERAWADRAEHYQGKGSFRHKTDEPLQDKDLPVSCPEREGSEPVEFPEAAWTGLFGRWRDIVGGCTEASLESLWGAFLLAAGLIIGRNAWRESPRPLYPNFYLLLVGQTGDSRKSTVMWFVCELLRHVGEDFKNLDGVVSSEGIYEALADHDDTKGLIYADEFRALLSVAKRKGTQDILPRLNSLYYCPERASIDRVKDSTTIVRPFLSLITATPQAYVEDILSDLEITGGFLNRFLIITGEEQAPKAIVKSPSAFAWESLAAGLREIHDRRPGCFELSREAAELWTKFYTEWKKERRTWQPKQSNLTARTFEHVLKIAVVYATLAKECEISAQSLATAITIGEWLQASTLRAFVDMGVDHFGKCERTIVDLLKRSKDQRMWRRDLQRAMSARSFNGEIFNRAIKALESNDQVRVYKVTSAAGKERPVVELYGYDT